MVASRSRAAMCCIALLALQLTQAVPLYDAGEPTESEVGELQAPAGDVVLVLPASPQSDVPVPAPSSLLESAAAPLQLDASPESSPGVEPAALPASAPVVQPAAVTVPASTAQTSSSAGQASSATLAAQCGAGCISGAVLGSLAFCALVLAAFLYFRRRRVSAKDEVLSTADLELLEYPVVPEQGIASVPPARLYSIGENVFCRKDRNCTFGTVIEILKGDEFLVRTYDGKSERVSSSSMAPNFSEGTEVWYTPPGGNRPSVRGCIIQADGSYWPPFYQLIPQGGEVNLVNTTADCLMAVKKGGPAHYINAQAA